MPVTPAVIRRLAESLSRVTVSDSEFNFKLNTGSDGHGAQTWWTVQVPESEPEHTADSDSGSATAAQAPRLSGGRVTAAGCGQ